MGDSTYELIGSTDDESLDGRGTESIADSTDLDVYPRPDDVHSVSGTEHSAYETESDEESEAQEEEHQSHTSSIRYADEALGSPSAQATTHLGYVSQAESTSLLEPIEFKEADSPIYLDKISVKHTITDFNETETAQIADNLHIANPPARLIATVRQTMSQGCLSTREPIRVLYVGHRAAERDIVYKISRAITSSQSTDYTSGKTVRRNTDGLYNIVPVGFGSIKDPEVALMEMSGYQIKVDPCTLAEEEVYKGDHFSDDIVYCLTIDGEKKYRSFLDAGGAQLQPAWSLPHVAIFYCTPSDDETTQKTRDIAWEFTNRHAIPSIFISEKETFTQPLSGRWRDFIDPHAVHLSIESRDPEHPIPPTRLPIDFASFMNIDHRQMNRNLAYLTGLQEPVPTAEELIDDVIGQSDNESVPEPRVIELSILKKLDDLFQDAFCSRAVYVILALLGVVLSNLLASYVFPSQNTAPVPNLPASVSTVSSPTPSSIASTATATVTINLTSTKTVRITSAEPSAISLLPFGGFLSDKAETATSESKAKSTICSVEMYSGNEILLKVAAGTKTTWLAKGAIDIDIYRGKDPVKSRLSTIDEGILVEINQKDAYGVLNVSVVTTRKPKINETFAVDFGRPLIVEAFEAGKDLLEEMAKKFAGSAADAAKVVEDSCAPVLNSVADKIKDEAASFTDSVKDAGKAAQDYSSRISSETVDRVKDTFQTNNVGRLWQGAQDALTQQLRSAEGIRDDVDVSILKAQVASRLWWLRVQGKTAEYEEYERKASRFLKKKHEENLKAKQARKADAESSKCSWRKGSCEAKKPKGLTHKWKSLRG